jgi:DnaJ domain
MMDPTVRVAIDLMHSPSQARRIRSASLPDDVVVLLRIASGDEEAISQAAGKLGRARETVREAATFYVVQILLFPDADSYRVLGVRPQATNGELRRNMTLLLRWLHPDLDPEGELSVFAARVTRAWNDLKTPERRAEYDRLQRKSLTEELLLRKKGLPRAQSDRQGFKHHLHNRALYAGHGASRRPLPIYAGKRIGLLRRVFLLLFGRTAP